MMKGPFAITSMRFPGIRLVEETEQKFRCIRVCLNEKHKTLKALTIKVNEIQLSGAMSVDSIRFQVFL